MGKLLTTEQFIEKAKQVHGNKYDYSKVEYKNNNTKIKILCPQHGLFQQIPRSHISGVGCPKCGKKSLTQAQFIEQAKQIYGDKYDYSEIGYKNKTSSIKVICPKHGAFFVEARVFLKGSGCLKCFRENQAKRYSLTTEQFIEKAKQVHGDKYDYSKVEYKNYSTKVCIICPEHGEFWQSPLNHLSGKGCVNCAGFFCFNTSSFIKKAKEIYGELYDYSKVNFKAVNKKVEIVCPKHGSFWKRPNDFIHKKAGCPYCRMSHLEITVKAFLEQNNIPFETQKRFNGCRNKKPLPFDFYLPKQNLCIECQGEQHFKEVKVFQKKHSFKYRQFNDQIKKNWCSKTENPNLLEIRYDDDIKKVLEEALKNAL